MSSQWDQNWDNYCENLKLRVARLALLERKRLAERDGPRHHDRRLAGSYLRRLGAIAIKLANIFFMIEDLNFRNIQLNGSTIEIYPAKETKHKKIK